ncbi:hypothetical protein A3A95_04305 [Candidatus Nomurabacteria bacterium RIFCSPLOWO2_01_FULL_39_18]|uniref:Uncharacterized protein n=1 Tax=Candidatus Nomurabacteria bacterium RIFCSPHIGHO2_01_FULL_40_24b TaxID=1801739 RepID=A0A1F6V659_9BACT|nr:MAG: hypothetical protein A2647_04220 [Candidatus Nomurabacteria bacterium RIFCSPHIGHO2_01_FULL_40_24b]OGI89319.1 MAG: hypothetical protein A3A95_04305 [Candidatus Nomurabacteria bacterium RIFCSPLOWO2_01_FULL_39_18]
MKPRIEKPISSAPTQNDLDFRTDAELVKSIREKRAGGVPLDEREGKFVDEQQKEDREDRDRLYRQ